MAIREVVKLRGYQSKFMFQSNPFVVLSDLTISLAIIFLVFGISAAIGNNQILLFFDRNDRQDALQREFIAAVKEVLGDVEIRQAAASQDGRAPIHLIKSGKIVAKLTTNASFQRVQLLEPTFQSGAPALTAFGEQVYAALGSAVSRHAEELSYVFLHGISEKSEATDRTALLLLSRERAVTAYGVFERMGAIGGAGIEPRFAIPYGTGAELYTNFPVSTSGRVDLLLFYNDSGGRRRGS